MPPAKSLSPSVEVPSPRRTMPPANSAWGWRSCRPLTSASAPAGTTTTGHGARLETSAETLPSKEERGPVEPRTIISAFSAAAAATSWSAGSPTSTSQPAPQSTSVASLEMRSRRSATAPISFLGVPSSMTRTNTRPRPSLLLRVRATRAAPLAASESSIPQMIEPAMKSPSVVTSSLPGVDRGSHRASSPSLRQVDCPRRDTDGLEARSLEPLPTGAQAPRHRRTADRALYEYEIYGELRLANPRSVARREWTPKKYESGPIRTRNARIRTPAIYFTSLSTSTNRPSANFQRTFEDSPS